MKKITSIEQLKKLSKDKSLECSIVLKGSLRSSKIVDYFEESDTFVVENLIDGSSQTLSPKQLNDRSITNIGHAIQCGALIY